MLGFLKRYGLKSCFAEDLRKRCVSELSGAKSRHASKKYTREQKSKVIAALKNTPTAIIECYKGNHKLCKKHSYVCFKGGRKSYRGENISMTETDEQLLLTAILKYLGPNAISRNYGHASTQKNEAVNRVFSKTNPKTVTSTRNFCAKVSAGVLLNNLNFDESVTLTHKIAEHRVSQSLLNKVKKVSRVRDEQKKRKKKKDVKARRAEITSEKYDSYKRKHQLGSNLNPGYQKGRYV